MQKDIQSAHDTNETQHTTKTKMIEYLNEHHDEATLIDTLFKQYGALMKTQQEFKIIIMDQQNSTFMM
jgi:hypothetical protein